MAKKAKVTMAAPAAIDSIKSRMYVDLEGVDVKQLTGLKVNDQVELLVTGTVKGLSQRERPDYENPNSKKTRKTGSIDLEDYRVQVLESENNEFSKMAAEMDSEGG